LSLCTRPPQPTIVPADAGRCDAAIVGRKFQSARGSASRKRSAVDRFLDVVERVGNALPDPTTLFALLAGRHPVPGLAAAFAGVSGGYSANLVLGTIDPLFAGLSQEAARIIDPSYVVSPAANYCLMFVSTFLITGLG
jgi:p-aminobenzoyl-glutamate transporter AbgT